MNTFEKIYKKTIIKNLAIAFWLILSKILHKETISI